jgi:hypothetical protein
MVGKTLFAVDNLKLLYNFTGQVSCDIVYPCRDEQALRFFVMRRELVVQ